MSSQSSSRGKPQTEPRSMRAVDGHLTHLVEGGTEGKVGRALCGLVERWTSQSSVGGNRDPKAKPCELCRIVLDRRLHGPSATSQVEQSEHTRNGLGSPNTLSEGKTR